MKTLYIKITGKVQNVNFRYSTKQLAEKLKLTGWVRNLENEGVEILANGNENNLKQLLDWAHHGPSNAKVKNIKYEWINKSRTFGMRYSKKVRDKKYEFDKFEIKY